MKAGLPQYSGRDYIVLGIFILPITIAINAVIFGTRLFADLPLFGLACLVTATVFTLDFILCGMVAVNLKKRLPRDEQTGTRLALMIGVFMLLTGLFLLVLFRGYEMIPYFDYQFNETRFTWACFGMGITNIFLTFLHEGISRYENWKANLRETEALRKVYRQSRYLCLKNQINPHFLFNSLNSLSSLIHEDEKKGEQFLDEMSKVYRYMLHQDEQLVTLDTELKFTGSYLFILKTRYNEALQVQMNISPEARGKWLPPLALQTIIESIISQNTIAKDRPLVISLSTGANGDLLIRNNVLPRIAAGNGEEDLSGMENLVRKYALLNQPELQIRHVGSEQTIRLPLITNKEEVLL